MQDISQIILNTFILFNLIVNVANALNIHDAKNSICFEFEISFSINENPWKIMLRKYTI